MEQIVYKVGLWVLLLGSMFSISSAAVDTVCTVGGTECEANEVCTDLTCACEPGYTGDSTTPCADADECANTADNNCDTNAACTNTVGSFTCACNSGYTGDGMTCTDVDECANANDNTCDTNAACTNTVGSFTCACNTGYTGDGVACTATLGADCSADATLCSGSDANSECDADTQKCVCKLDYIDGGAGACSKAADNSAGRTVIAAVTAVMAIITTTNLF